MGTFYYLYNQTSNKTSDSLIYIDSNKKLRVGGGLAEKNCAYLFFITKSKANTIIASINKGSKPTVLTHFTSNDIVQTSKNRNYLVKQEVKLSKTNPSSLSVLFIEMFQSNVSLNDYLLSYASDSSYKDNVRLMGIYCRNNGQGDFYIYDGPISEIKRGEDYKIKKYTNEFYKYSDSAIGKTMNTFTAPSNSSHVNGFFYSAGRYVSGKQWTKSGSYLCYSKTSKKDLWNGKAKNKNDAMTWGANNDSSNAQLIELVSGSNKKVGYKNVNWDGTGGSSGSGDESSGGISVADDNSYDIESADFPTERYAGVQNLVDSYDSSKYNMYFLGCKDSRTTKTINDPLGEKYAANKFVGGVSAGKTNSNVKKSNSNWSYLLLQPYIHRDMATSLGTIEEGVWKTSVRSSSSISTSTNIIAEIDTLLDIDRSSSTTTGWLRGYAPLKKISPEVHSNAWVKHRTLPYSALIVPNDTEDSVLKDFVSACKKSISFTDYFNLSAEERSDYKTIYYAIEITSSVNDELIYTHSYKASYLTEDEQPTFQAFLDAIMLVKKEIELSSYTYEVVLSSTPGKVNLYSLELFPAYTRGHDFIQEKYTTVRPNEQDSNGNRLMTYDDNYFTYKYTGRDIDIFQGRKDNELFALEDSGNKTYCALIHEKDLLLSTDVTLGETYGEQKYFIEAIKYPELNSSNERTGNYLYKDTFKITNYLEAVDNTKYVKDDLEIVDNAIDLTKCEFYDPTAATFENHWCDCCYNKGDKGEFKQECYYQKTGKCPYRFQTEKHPRRIRTLKQSKSNRFNLIQELSKVFEFYPYFYIEYDRNGKVKLDENGKQKKHVFFMTEKGSENYSGFRYEKNLSSVSRTIDSDSLTTRLIVEPVDSELTATGLCSIALATDNLSRENSIYNFDYYVQKGLLDREQVQRDLYGIEKDDLAYLTRVGNYNTMYDNYTNLIITMTGDMLTKLAAQIEVSSTGVGTALEERQKKSQQMYQFKQQAEKTANLYSTAAKTSNDYLTSDTYLSYLYSYRNLTTNLFSEIETLFFSNDNFCYVTKDEKGELVQTLYNYANDTAILTSTVSLDLETLRKKYCKGEFFFRLEIEGFEEYPTYTPPFDTWELLKKETVDTQAYKTNGSLGQYNSLYNQVKYWKLQRARILNKINDLYETFYQKYEPFIKEGTWTDSNYLSDNAYYWAANSVIADSCKPQVSYSFSVIDISPLEEYSDDYTFELADTTYLEDIDFFDINKKTGLPNRQKVMISEITYNLDEPSKNSITVQNYSSQFDDLFGAITASVQSLTFNENMYKRAANFTPQQYVQAEALQGTLDEGDLTLIDANDENVVMDDSGAKGKNINNTSSQYDLNGQGLFFSNDGGNTWDLGVGPQGINMDYAKFGSLDASKVQIVDGNYIYFLWDKNGINAYRDPSSSTTGLVDFARFNKYGLSLIENNNVRLRAGYAFKSTANTGDYTTEADLTNQNVGFYLYNDKGQAIFKTETASAYNKAANSSDYTARLSLDGEMFVTNTILEDEKENYSVLSASLGNQLINGLSLVSASAYYADNILIPSDTTISGDAAHEFYICITEGEQKQVPDTDSESITNPITIVKYTFNRKSSTSWAEYLLDLSTREISPADTTKTIADYTYTTETYSGFSLGTKTIAQWIADKTPTEGTEIMKLSKLSLISYTSLIPTTIKIQADANVNARANISSSVSAETIGYYVIPSGSNWEGLAPIVEQLYSYTSVYEGVTYSYWKGYGEGASVITNSTDASIEQIGIWINNKIPSNRIGSDSNISGVVESAETEDSESTNSISVVEEDVDEVITSKVCDLSTMYFVGDSVTEGWSINGPNLSATELQDFSSRMTGYGGKGFGGTGSTGDLSWISGKVKSDATHVAFNFGINGFSGTISSFSDSEKETIKNNYTSLITAAVSNCDSLSHIYIVSPIYAPSTSVIGNTTVGKYLPAVREALMSIDWGTISNAEVSVVDIWEVTKNYCSSNDVHSNDYKGCIPAVYNAINSAAGTSGTSTTISDNINEDAEKAVAQLNKGAERIFLIGAKTDTSYRNILSVLKNGSLFIGGEIRDEMGGQIETQFEYMPDKIKIINPQITMSIDGYMWCDWSKFFNIGYDSNGNLLYQVNNSLADYLNAISGGGSSGDTDSGLTGYYFLDPMG